MFVSRRPPAKLVAHDGDATGYSRVGGLVRAGEAAAREFSGFPANSAGRHFGKAYRG